MKLRQVFVRFYKSFNDDYERKAHPDARGESWEILGDIGWFPHVRLPLEPDVTAIVGANESGKSHLIDAIKILLGDGVVRREDFCRYSPLFSVETGEIRYPEIAGLFQLTNQSEAEAISSLGFAVRVDDEFVVVRTSPDQATLRRDDMSDPVELTGDQLGSLKSVLPRALTLKTKLALPDSVSIAELADGSGPQQPSRRARNDTLNLLAGERTEDAQQVQTKAPTLVPRLFALLFGSSPPSVDREAEAQRAQQELARKLLIEVARIDQESFRQLARAMNEENEGMANALIKRMNDSLTKYLNLPHWWAQDSDFQLRLSPREKELVFTIRDRTGTDYSFKERSTGLRYFLSYYIQVRALQRSADRSDLLLMDEPDAFLSAEGQQDLLKILEDFATPETGESSAQVIYVTHSPFLLNKNAAHRIRLLDKGVGDEGTRVVKDATRNHYEPLRSSLGAFMAETAFIGGANLFVEGMADQILLATISTRLLRSGAAQSSCLDLNKVTLVHSGGARNVPYMAYLARGRDELKPPCAVLLDGDDEGHQVAKDLEGEGGPQVLDPKFIVQIDEWAAGEQLVLPPSVTVREIEDLIPLNLAAAAAQSYAVRLMGRRADETSSFTADVITGRLSTTDGSVWKALQGAFHEAFGATIYKLGFARELIALPVPTAVNEQDHKDLGTNIGRLIAHLASVLRAAESEESAMRTNNQLRRTISGFAKDHPAASTRDEAALALSRLENTAEDSPVGDDLKLTISALRRDFKLAEDPTKPVGDYLKFLDRFRNLQYAERLGYRAKSAAEAAEGATIPRPKGGRSATKKAPVTRASKQVSKSAASRRSKAKGAPSASAEIPE